MSVRLVIGLLAAVVGFGAYRFIAVSRPATTKASATPAENATNASGDSIVDLGVVYVGERNSLTALHRIANRGDRALRLRFLANYAPCCGTTDFGSAVVPPGESHEIPVALKVGASSVALEHRIALKDEDSEQVVHLISRAAVVVPAELVERTPPPTEIAYGQSAKAHYAVSIVGRTAEDVKKFAANIGLRSSVPADWSGFEELKDADRGLIRWERAFEVECTGKSVGLHTGVVHISLGNGKSLTKQVGWRVAPAVSAHPPAAVFRKPNDPIEVRVRSADGKKFALLKRAVENATVVARCPEGSAVEHIIQFSAKGPIKPGANGALTLAVDHPSQNSVSVVYLFARSEGAP